MLAEGKPASFAELRVDEPRRIYAVSVSPVGGAAGAPGGIVVVISDVTEARLMEEQLLQSEKLSAIGEMISGVAHELNNPLASVMGFAQLLQDARVGEDVKRKLGLIYSESQRCQRVVQNLLSFARKHRPEKRLLDLNSALQSVLQLLSYQLRVDGVEVRASLDPQLPGIHGDFHLLQQVFLNIINNAHQAMRETAGPRVLEVVSGLRAGRRRPPQGRTGPGSRSATRGPASAPENLKRIFDPFFTTKQPGQGTGLGLSLAFGAVNDHGGRIHARSQPGKGTTFVVELPRGAVAAPVEEAREEAPVAPGAAPPRSWSSRTRRRSRSCSSRRSRWTGTRWNPRRTARRRSS